MTKKLIIEHCSNSKERFWDGTKFVEKIRAKQYRDIDALPETIYGYKKVMIGKIPEYHGPKGTRLRVLVE